MSRLTKTELIDALATKSGLDKKDVKSVLGALKDVAEEAVKSHGEVPIDGIGKLKVADRAARTGRHPQTGEPMQIPASTKVKFTVAKNLKDLAKG